MTSVQPAALLRPDRDMFEFASSPDSDSSSVLDSLTPRRDDAYITASTVNLNLSGVLSIDDSIPKIPAVPSSLSLSSEASSYFGSSSGLLLNSLSTNLPTSSPPGISVSSSTGPPLAPLAQPAITAIPAPSTPSQLLARPQITPIDALIRTEIACSTAKASAKLTATRFAQLVLHHAVLSRLNVSLSRLHAALAESSRHDATKFASAYQQALELHSHLLRDDCIRPSHFLASLSRSQRRDLNFFLALIKTAPTFIATALLAMSSADLNAFIQGPSADIYEDVASLNRTRPLDILYFSVFPADTDNRKRMQFFATVCAALIDHDRGEVFCFAILDRIMDSTGHPYAPALQTILATLLQEGGFLTTQNSHIGSPQIGTPSSEFPSPELSSVSLANSKAAKLRKPSSVSLSSSSDDPIDPAAQEFLAKSVDRLVEMLDNPTVGALPDDFLFFCRLVISKVSASRRRQAWLLMALKYFFCKHLHRIIVFPERLGLLADHFISELQRKKVLSFVFRKVYQLAMASAHAQTSSASSATAHIESVMARFNDDAGFDGGPGMGSRGDSYYSLAANMSDSHLYASPGDILVLTPSDIVCLYAGLFPSFMLHQRSMSATNLAAENPRPPRPTSYYAGSAASSSYVGSEPYSAGIMSSMNESLPSLSEGETGHYSDSAAETATPVFSPADEVEGWSLESIKKDLEPVMERLVRKFAYLRVRENSQVLYSLRPSKLQQLRVPHPLTDQWEIFMMGTDWIICDVQPEDILSHLGGLASADSGASAPMTPREDDVFTSSVVPALPVAPANRGLLSAVKKALGKLVGEVAGSPFPISVLGKSFYNGNPVSSGFPGGAGGIPTLNLGSAYLSSAATDRTPRKGRPDDIATDESGSLSVSYLVDVLSEAQDRSMAQGRFVDASEYLQALTALRKLLPSTSNPSHGHVACRINNYIVFMLSREKNFNLQSANSQIDMCREYGEPYKVMLHSSRVKSKLLMEKLASLRTKVWYMTEIRSTALWNRARNVALALAVGSSEAAVTEPWPHMTASQALLSSASLRRNSSSSSLASVSAFSFKRFTSTSSKRDYANRRQSTISATNVTPVTTTDTLFAPRVLAGDSKLSDREAEATRKWLHGQNIQNFCCGEERIHRFCCEVDDLVKRVMGDALSPRRNKGQSLLSSSMLFRSDLWKLINDVEGPNRASGAGHHHRASIGATVEFDLEPASGAGLMRNNSGSRPSAVPERSSSFRVHRPQKSTPNFFDMFDLQGRRSQVDVTIEPPRDSLDHQSPHSRNRSLNDFDYFNSQSPESAPEAGDAEADARQTELNEIVLDLQMSLTSLIYTDLGSECFASGSETDHWMAAPIVAAIVEHESEQSFRTAVKNQPTVLQLSDPPEGRRKSRLSLNRQEEESEWPQQAEGSKLETAKTKAEPKGSSNFSYDEAYKRLLLKLSITPSPMGKLQTLYELEMLVVSSLSHGPTVIVSTPGSVKSHRTRSNLTSLGSEATTALAQRASSGYTERYLPRNTSSSAMTSLEETIASVEAKRNSSGAFGGPGLQRVSGIAAMSGPNTDAIADEMRRVLKNCGSSSHTLFRDLQFIAAFVPPHKLDMSDLGKAFWDVSLAALSMKDETLRLMVDCSAELFQYKSGMVVSSGGDQQAFLSPWSLSDCAWLWGVAAKEGNVVGQRELAMMHISHPELTPIGLLPLAKVSEVFDMTQLSDDPHLLDDLDKYDPVRMSVVKHWMSSAASYGDEIAKEYLIQESAAGYI